MSYDLHVFSQRALDRDELRGLVVQAGLGVEEAGAAGDALTVIRGVKARYSFTLGLPSAVEAEDVPEEVTAALLAPAFSYEVLVEGSSPTETPHAVRFARRLAEASGGVVLDPQTGQTWLRGKLRISAPVPRGQIDIVELRWYARAGDSADSAARAWLEVAHSFLPEALPRRFGPVEPLAMKLAVDGPEAFTGTVAGEDMSVYFKASTPCVEGNLAGGARSMGVRSHAMSVHRDPLHDPRWRDALEKFFVEFATRTGAFFASAEVQRGLEWSGRSISFGASVEPTTYLAPRGSWAGLLPYPAWWTWFGPEYAPLVADHLPADLVRPVGEGLFHSNGAAPLDRDQLTAALARPGGSLAPRGGLRSLFSRQGRESAPDVARTWLPGDLLATVDNSDPKFYNPPLTAAVTMPASLRPDT